MTASVLCLITDGFEEIETITPVDLLRRAGAEVVLASLSDSLHVTGRSGITMSADIRYAELGHRSFDMLFLPGGPQIKAMRVDGRAVALARSFALEQKLIAAICAAPTVLKDAGLLEGRQFTAHSSVHGELATVLADERVVEDGQLITSRGAGTALDFGLALVRRLFGDAKAREVASSIMA